jgi:hypothetical protein
MTSTVSTPPPPTPRDRLRKFWSYPLVRRIAWRAPVVALVFYVGLVYGPREPQCDAMCALQGAVMRVVAPAPAPSSAAAPRAGGLPRAGA